MASPEECGELLSHITPIHSLLHILPDKSSHQPVYLLQTHNSLKTAFESKAQYFHSFLSLSIQPSHSHDASLCMSEMPKFINQGLLLRFHPFFTFLTKAVLLFPFVILQPHSETDEASNTLFFHRFT